MPLNQSPKPTPVVGERCLSARNVAQTRRTARRAVLVTGIIATVGAAVSTTPEVLTQLAVFVASVFVSGVLLVALFCTRWFQSASTGQQTRRIWIASGAAGFIVWAVYWIPMILKI